MVTERKEKESVEKINKIKYKSKGEHNHSLDSQSIRKYNENK